MRIEEVLNAQEITRLAKERFKEERATDHLEGWFLAKEIMRECDERFRDEKTAYAFPKRWWKWRRRYRCGSATIMYSPERRMTHLQDHMR